MGHYIYVYAPHQYLLLLDSAKEPVGAGRYRPIRAHTIESIALKSELDVFKTVRFRKALIEYQRFGTRPPAKADWTKEDIVHYAKYSHHIYELYKQNGTER